MGQTFETRFHLLPRQGKIQGTRTFWSGDYWPLNQGNINRRWNASRGFDLSAPRKEAALRMSQEELSQLSPSEKFDLLNGLYHYPLRQEVERIADPRAADWEGICDGWAAASMNHAEPVPKTILNPDGIRIPFGSSDIKGLLSYFYAYHYHVESTFQVGQRCDKGPAHPEIDCKQDLNAGAFHIILANKLGLQGKGFIADVNRFKQVWNHPVIGYETKVLRQGRHHRDNVATRAFRTVEVQTRISYVAETDNTWDAVIGTRRQKLRHSTFFYQLELDINGIIIGGEWRGFSRPDFLWLKHPPQYFTGMFYRLQELVSD